jgi:hypothetical protein
MQDELEAIFRRPIDSVEREGLRNPFRRYANLSSREILHAAYTQVAEDAMRLPASRGLGALISMGSSAPYPSPCVCGRLRPPRETPHHPHRPPYGHRIAMKGRRDELVIGPIPAVLFNFRDQRGTSGCYSNADAITWPTSRNLFATHRLVNWNFRLSSS